MDRNEIIELAEKILAGTASEQELARYNDWFNSAVKAPLKASVVDEIDGVSLFDRVRQTIESNKRKRYKTKLKYAFAAASIILCLGIGSYLLKIQNNHKTQSFAQIISDSLSPGKDQALLILSDGTQLDLNQTNVGQIAALKDVKVSKLNNGEVVYQNKNKLAAGASVGYNELRTPRAGQYKLTLPDGTKAWLNSASSIRFPNSFNGNQRTVSVSGEVYFEVAHNAQKPFIVSVNDIKIKVLGTHFNINDYRDEGVFKTTLVEGSVSVMKGANQVFISPGEQAQIRTGQAKISVRKVDAENTVAWTKGFMALNNSNIKEFMGNLSRWFDIDVEYKGTIPTITMGGLINRNVPLSDIISALNAAGIDVQLLGRKMIVSQKK